MDLNDLYDDMDDDELGELGASFSVGGRLSTSGRSSLRTSTRRPRTRLTGGLFGRLARVARKSTRKVSSARKRALLRAMMKRKAAAARKKKKRRKPKRRRTTSKKKTVMRLKHAPISHTCPAAYRQLACNAGVGGAAGIALLNQIKAMVDLNNTRQLATSEHNRINKTAAFRRAVLKRLSKRVRCR